MRRALMYDGGDDVVDESARAPARADPARESRWLELLRPEFARLGATPPARLQAIYRSFVEDDAMLAMLVAERPKVVSFHFGIPSRKRITALHGPLSRAMPAGDLVALLRRELRGA